jgi:hypothetical protein
MEKPKKQQEFYAELAPNKSSTANLAAVAKVPRNDSAWVKSYVEWVSRVLDKRTWPADKD